MSNVLEVEVEHTESITNSLKGQADTLDVLNSTTVACRTCVHTSMVLQEVFRELQGRCSCKRTGDHQECVELNLRCQIHLVVLGNGT